jgi:uncharacterized membrane protein YkvA (DUF1232 family)
MLNQMNQMNQMNLSVSLVIMFLASLLFVGPYYVAMVSLVLVTYTIFCVDIIPEEEKPEEYTIMTRSRTRRQKLA